MLQLAFLDKCAIETIVAPGRVLDLTMGVKQLYIEYQRTV